ncbi:isoprenylcysteine carboxylmethyltransferase family protein [Paludicola sp. MB14-C6]|uniref:methyltransferase family protein n=1 Tax=Paludihabitans sp. MB14-C6 TaxID=3070656 RepID=UPI0027DB9743|nr:isoprenylcysteine carboxylmethyltransferase family protein [Paludicola sp. MB14-C6]WMJ24029.1 isoprenylcysteine carboxylmethyltransferase family protein [Paludicola sp. MB14-C6]
MQNSIFLICNMISVVCLWLLLSAITLNFMIAKKQAVKKEKKSIVETGSMFLFFVAMVLLVYLRIGTIHIKNSILIPLMFIGTFLIVVGTVINILGRFTLKMNWGNQIRIYQEHTLIKNGIYHFIRHPLYASTILMIYGFSILYANFAVFICNTLIFIPFMIYRAKQEETMLIQTFQEKYIAYQQCTGLFLPKWRRKKVK